MGCLVKNLMTPSSFVSVPSKFIILEIIQTRCDRNNRSYSLSRRVW